MTRRALPSALGLLLAALAACSGPSPLDAPDAGRSAAYQPGLPDLDLEAVPAIRDGQPGLVVYTSLPRASLVFTKADSAWVARYDLSLRVTAGRDTEAFLSFGDTLRVDAPEATRAPERLGRQTWVALAPGVYTVEAVLEDAASGEQAVRQQRVEVTAPGRARLGRPLVLAHRGEGELEPVVALHTARRDSLASAVAVYDAPAGSTLALQVLRLRADTSVAVPPFWLSPSRGSLAFRGTDAGAADTLVTERRALGGAAEQEARFDLPALSLGVYQLDVVLRGPDGRTLDEASRTLAVEGPGFPQLATLAELVDALAYIAYPREVQLIREGASAAERRRRFDAFWGSLVPDRRVAGTLLRRYYERVEEANRLFTSVKPGWKTDRGMVYVVFGAPEYVETTFEGETWYYAYGSQDAASTFVFERASPYEVDPFGHYVLVRQPAYERAWGRALRRWREGSSL